MEFDPASRIDWYLDERLRRYGFALAATLAGIATIITRDDPAVDWSLIGPVVVLYWLWARFAHFLRWPVYLLGIVIPLVLNIIEDGPEVSMMIAVITVALMASSEPKRWVVKAFLTLLFVLLTIFSAFVYDEFAWQNWTFGLLFAWGAGTLVYRYERTLAELKLAREVVADQAAVHERRRIARDVHDLVGHSLSVVMLHVTGARHLLRRDPDEAEQALEQAEQAARESLAEIRRTVGLLRDERDPSQPPLPSPDLGDLRELIDDFIFAGLEIDLMVTGPIDRVNQSSGVAGYRIVQEALTNVSRHTVGADVSVSVAVIGETLELSVENRNGAMTEGRGGSGFGLVSMRERAKSVGGSLVAGPAPAGWVVEASLPVSPVRVSPA